MGLDLEEVDQSRCDAVCPERVRNIEAQLREAQCHQLHTPDQLYLYKKTHVRHQVANTRACEEISTQDVRKHHAVRCYRHARRAKLALSGPGTWERELRVLDDADIRNIQDDDPSTVAARRHARGNKDPGPAEGRRQISWIWRSSDLEGTDEMIDSLRMEWLKACARMMQWEEEVNGRKMLCPPDAAMKEGLSAYAFRQALIQRCMRTTVAHVCRDEVAAEKGRITMYHMIP
ncbi:hypothetical protein C8Q80DRAFT_1222068 [Daedaleopsis nitida]|nr:hypothetical protein C8Q80DRAFT_1222068 [Daedaleopsis nitida]